MNIPDTVRPYNQVARAAAQQRTRNALLDAAEQEFFADVWQHASLEAIATAAGVTKQTLLRHFGSKDGLLEETMRRGLSEIRDQRWSAPADDVEGALENLLDHYEQWGERALRVGAIEGGPPGLSELASTSRQVHYDWIEYVFGSWLSPLRGDARLYRRAALIAVCDVHVWRLLSHDLALRRPAVLTILTNLVEGVLKEES
jgi:AcrR family transcriptional regulator